MQKEKKKGLYMMNVKKSLNNWIKLIMEAHF